MTVPTTRKPRSTTAVTAAPTPHPAPGELRPYPVSLDERELLAGVRRANPELASIRHEVAAALLGIDLARRAYYPDLMVGLEFMRSGEMNRSGVGAMVSVTPSVMSMTILPLSRNDISEEV